MTTGHSRDTAGVETVIASGVGSKTVIARSEATKQSIVTVAGLLRGACHRARIRATRWVAMTATIFAHPATGRTDSIFKQPAVYKHSFAISPRLSREFDP